MKKTKDRILNASVSLFNQKGVVNVRLQHLADEAFLSIGNLAYHFKNKEAIVTAIHEELATELKALMAELNIVPLFEYMDHYFHQLFLLQRHFAFFFTDMLEVFRNYPEIKEEHVQLIDWQKSQYRQMLTFNENRGVLSMNDWPDQLDFTIDQLWMQSYMYGAFQSIHDQPQTNEEYCNRIWGIVIPLMTKIGRQEFKQLGKGIVM